MTETNIFENNEDENSLEEFYRKNNCIGVSEEYKKQTYQNQYDENIKKLLNWDTKETIISEEELVKLGYKKCTEDIISSILIKTEKEGYRAYGEKVVTFYDRIHLSLLDFYEDKIYSREYGDKINFVKEYLFIINGDPLLNSKYLILIQPYTWYEKNITKTGKYIGFNCFTKTYPYEYLYVVNKDSLGNRWRENVINSIELLYNYLLANTSNENEKIRLSEARLYFLISGFSYMLDLPHEAAEGKLKPFQLNIDILYNSINKRCKKNYFGDNDETNRDLDYLRMALIGFPEHCKDYQNILGDYMKKYENIIKAVQFIKER